MRGAEICGVISISNVPRKLNSNYCLKMYVCTRLKGAQSYLFNFFFQTFGDFAITRKLIFFS